MSKTYVSSKLRKQVHTRANGQCEYCLSPEQLSLAPFSIDHVIAEKHGGTTELNNLALSCTLCNRNKGSDIASIDPRTGLLCPLYNPRTNKWIEHFSIEEAVIIPHSARGRVTLKILKINKLERVKERRLLLKANLLKLPKQ